MINLSKFAERLEELIFYTNKKAADVAEEIGIDRVTMFSYLHCKYAPSITSLVKLSNYFNCTTDFLLGLENENSSRNFKDCPPFSERIKFLLESKEGYTGYLFCKEAKISESNFYDWKNGKREPSVDNVVKIAKFLDCSVDYVLGREV